MKLAIIIGLAIMLLISASCIFVGVYACCPSGPAGVSPNEMINFYKQALNDQQTKDSQIISFLVAIIIGLGSVVVAFTIIFLRNRKLQTKPNPES